MLEFLLVALAGAVGVVARYGLTLVFTSLWTVAAINLMGSLVLGVLVHLGAGWERSARDAIGVGLIGGFTTLSTLTTQTVLEASGGRQGTAVLYLVVNVAGGLMMAYAGHRLGRALA